MGRRLFRLLVVLSVIFVLGVVAVWVLTNTDFGRERVRRFALGALQGATHGIVRIGALHGNLLSGATLVDVAITDSAGRPFIAADSISGRYVLRGLLSKRVYLDDLTLYRPRVVVEKLPGGEWNYRRLWPQQAPSAPTDTLPGWGSWVKFTNVTVLNGDVVVRSPWEPRTGLSARVRDSVITDALNGGSRLAIVRAPGGFQKVIELAQVNGKFPLVRIADPDFENRLIQVAAMSTKAYPFRPPPADIRALTGNFEFNDDSLWWKGAGVRLPASNLRGDGMYNISNGDMRLTLAASPARFADFTWLYKHFPADGGGNLGLQVEWKGATQDYLVRNADVRTGGAHLTGNVGVTVADTVFFHDADVRFTGVTTKQIEELVPGTKSPREGVLSGRAKFAGTFRRLDLAAADLTFDAYGRGRSHVLANGVIGVRGAENVVSARNLRVRLAPLQVDLLKIIIPTMPIGGTLSGSLTMNGSGDTRLVMSDLDVVHQDGPNRSHATGIFAVHTTGRRSIDVDVVASPLALAEIRKFTPSIPFIGSASGPIHAHGPIDALEVDTRLALPDGATFALTGTVDFLSKELGYDVRVASTDLNLSRVVSGMPATSLTGGGTARGRGFKPATMHSELSFAFGPSSLDTIAVDSVNVQATIANGLAQVARAELRAHSARVDVAGQFGLDASHSGSLTYAVQVDSLGALAPYIPALGADTGVVTPRPKLAAEILRRALADSARVDKQTEVARAISGAPPPRVQVDTPVAIPRGLVAGSVSAKGTIVGSIDRFTLEGTLSGSGIVARGNAARHVEATYSWVDAKTAHAKMNVALTADTVSLYGFAFDSVSGDLSYAKPNGTVAIRIRQGSERDYALRGDFTLDNARNELRLADVTLRFDTTTWQTTHPAAIRWGGRGIEVVNLELRSGPTQRLYANGLLPTSGPANFELAVTNFNVANIADLLQSDLQATGIVSFDAHVQGTAESPRVRGTLSLVDATYQGTPVPNVSGTFDYADQRLAVNATARDSTGRQLAQINGTIPINLALSGVTGSRLLDLPIDVSLVSDSLPIDLIPKLTDAVTDVTGRALGNVRVGGTLKHPVLQGEVTLVDGGFKLAATGATFSDVNGHVRMTGDSVFVDSVTARSGGPIRLSGTLGIGNWREPSFNLFLTAREAVVLNDKRGKIYASAGLRVSGPFDSAYVSGQVTVTHGVFYIPETSGKKLVAAGDPALFAVMDTAIASQRDIFPAQSPLFRNLRVDVDLVVQRNTWVRSRDANVEIFTDGPMRVSVIGDALTLVGAVDADRGEYTFLSKRFQIKRGSALFIGAPDINPTLQVTAEYVVKQPTGATNIQVLIGGTLQNPRLTLTSDAQPPLSQSDLLSYLAFGSSSGTLLQFNQTSLTQGGNLINVASARLAGVALGEALNQVEGDAARSLGVDVFNITPGDVPVLAGQSGITQFVTGTEVEAGKYLSPSTYATVIATPGAFVLNGGGLKVPPGVSLSHRTSKGYRFETSYGPRYILNPPTLSGQSVSGIGQFGAFVIREWRF
jgi:translocation and assembly module TamB